jgi:hypothetical protein
MMPFIVRRRLAVDATGDLREIYINFGSILAKVSSLVVADSKLRVFNKAHRVVIKWRILLMSIFQN